MNIDKRERLIEEIKAIGLPEDIEETPTVSLESFFIGNNDLGSIGCNLFEHPGISLFYETLKNLRSRPDVNDVVVGIYEVEESDPTMWPFSEQVYILTTLSPNKTKKLLKPLQPDEISEVPIEKITPKKKLPNGFKLLEAWWD